MAKHLVKRGSKYSVRYVVPKRYWSLLGRRQVWQSTGTGDLRQAEKRSHRILADIHDAVERQVRQARAGKFTESADNPRSTEYVRAAAENLFAQVQSGQLNTDDAGEILSLRIDEHLASLKADPESLSGTHLQTLRSATALVSNPNAQPLGIVVDRYLTEHEKKWPLSTWERKRKWLTAFKDWTENADINAIDRKAAGRYMSEVLQPMDVSWSTKNWILSALSPFFNWAIRKGIYSEANPWTGMAADIAESKRGSAKKTGKRRPWTAEELKVLSTLPADSPTYQVAMLQLWAGLRTEEAAALKVKDIDLKARSLFVSEGKNDNSVRYVPIHSKLLPLVTRLVDDAKDEWLIPGLEPGGKDNKRSHALSKVANRWLRANVSKDPRIVYYTLRKTFGTALENAGVDLTRRQRLMGHTPSDITSSTYSDGPELEKLRESLELVDFDL